MTPKLHKMGARLFEVRVIYTQLADDNKSKFLSVTQQGPEPKIRVNAEHVENMGQYIKYRETSNISFDTVK